MAAGALVFLAPAVVSIAPEGAAGAALLGYTLSAGVGALSNLNEPAAGALAGGVSGAITGPIGGTNLAPFKAMLASAISQLALQGKIDIEKVAAAGIAGGAATFQGIAAKAAGAGQKAGTLLEQLNAAFVSLLAKSDTTPDSGEQARDLCQRDPRGCGQPAPR